MGSAGMHSVSTKSNTAWILVLAMGDSLVFTQGGMRENAGPSICDMLVDRAELRRLDWREDIEKSIQCDLYSRDQKLLMLNFDED